MIWTLTDAVVAQLARRRQVIQDAEDLRAIVNVGRRAVELKQIE